MHCKASSMKHIISTTEIPLFQNITSFISNRFNCTRINYIHDSRFHLTIPELLFFFPFSVVFNHCIMAVPNEPIAVIGTGCRFPGGASSPSKLWNLLHHPYDLTQKVPSSRFNIKAFYHPNGEHHGTTNATKSYFLNEDPTTFDAPFFNINPREAEALDPQQRLLLETVYEALEAAGLSIEGMQGTSTAVYVGLMCADYFDVLMRDIEDIPQYLATGTARSIMSNRISYFFDWKGPSMTIDTACSSSLVAVHNAISTLRSGQSRTAIAAGANLIFGPEMYIGESNLHMLSPTGKSQMWDSKADGYARGEGTAAIVLKTLKNALEDGDDIEYIIREVVIFCPFLMSQ